MPPAVPLDDDYCYLFRWPLTEVLLLLLLLL
jgi:hypothetical protein